MNQFMSTLEKYIIPLANKLQANNIIQSISTGMMAMMPIMMVGAFASLLKGLPINVYQQFLTSSHLADLLNTIINVTNNMLALYAAFSIANTYTTRQEKDGFAAGLISLMSFFIVTPMLITGEGYSTVTNLPLTWLGSTGLFTAIIIAILASKIYVFILDKNLVIKLPEGVPEFVSKAFVSIIPGVLIVSVFALIAYVVQFTSFKNLHQVIYGLIQLPLQGIGGSVWAALLVYVLIGLCWFFGVHGMAIIMVVAPLWMAADAENMAAVSNGVANSNLPHIITFNWIGAVATCGGAGATIGLVILLTYFSKSKQYKALGKMVLIPSLFNINEPVVFGLPCMLNPVLFIPFLFTPVLLIALAYVLTVMGILPISNGIGAPIGTPLVITGLFNGGWRLALYQVVSIFISLAIYYPFFKIIDKRAFEEEKAAEK
ncbi:PTS system cellobiose-specific IIC component [Clostridium saccharoperbutylacetonicum]|uniref:Permease IIC component n=1 Tax=Clostridium saccharoperbutylacetonicum N1-4(HMT) TaxID=931276 RepID=M1MGH6_9CLOT|nr:PTS transporter subunit EIIC [Clostridium saccharoperbutylacetonicum]AGF57029.1 cellobiose permease IIC component CelB [Clostridium saccharoperbutylacetonicum N1-4(HMT)]NRT62212.1 PTS system cellobiose-specific IIC component [Clostridium saccharoperbutylacetonicum]NSB25543.1 PTS system cellobiose-specific IIC component [Clostridium saccharoperbutylacetonicum]NSB44913.1 PTS system cellobiose-specific IIC component [Clostridium saccharoperbutylacetonicum]